MRSIGGILGEEPTRASARAGAGALDRPAPHHELARRQAAAGLRQGGTRHRPAQQGGAPHVPRLVRCRSTATASSTAIRISAITRSGPTAASICSISAASASFPPSFVKGVIDLYDALERGDRALAVACLRELGFHRPHAARSSRC